MEQDITTGESRNGGARPDGSQLSLLTGTPGFDYGSLEGLPPRVLERIADPEAALEARVRAAFDAYLRKFGSAAGSALATRLHDIACDWVDPEVGP